MSTVFLGRRSRTKSDLSMKMYEEEIQVCGPELELSVVRTSPGITTHPFKPWGLLSSETRGLSNHRAQQSSAVVQGCRASHSHHTEGVPRHLCFAELPWCVCWGCEHSLLLPGAWLLSTELLNLWNVVVFELRRVCLTHKPRLVPGRAAWFAG